ncbi:AAA family ATPase, partial [Singulisphaera rosea]
MSGTPADLDLAELEDLRSAHDQIRAQIARQIVGQDEVVDQLLIAVFARGHCILEGVPGLAKTLMVHSLAQSLSLDFSRIQFTPDLMPSDITGTEVLYEDRNTGARELRFVQGPIFANLLLADEINRTPPKTQAALLEAMQERQVTAGGHRHVLPDPFFVLATQNPIEQEGTYPLPEAQLDRFLFKIYISYPTPDEERRIYRLTTGSEEQTITPLLTGERIAALQKLVRRVPVSDHCIDYAMDL